MDAPWRDRKLLELVASKLSEKGVPCFVTMAWNIAINTNAVKGSEEAFLNFTKLLLPPHTMCEWELHGNVYCWLGVYYTCSRNQSTECGPAEKPSLPQ